MSKPDWTTAPQGATHWDTEFDGFCIYTGWWYKGIFVDVDYHDDWGTGRYIERPPADQSMPADLEDLARTVLEWNESLDRVCKHTIGVEWFSSEHYPGRHGYSQSEWLQARRDLGLVTTEGEDEAFDAIGKRSVFDEIVEGFDALGKGNVKSFRVQDKQSRYQDTTGEDWIDEAARTFTAEEFRGAMRFTIGKYNRRMGKKDDLISEIEKIRDYATRWLEVEQGQ